MLNNFKGKISEHLIVTIIILFQGTFLVILNQHFDYINKYSFITKIFNLLYFVLSIIFLKYFWLLKDKVDELNSNPEMDNNAFNFSALNGDDFR